MRWNMTFVPMISFDYFGRGPSAIHFPFSEQFSHVGNIVSLIGGCDRSIRFTRNLDRSCSLILSSVSVRQRIIVFAVTIEH